jgi:cobalt-zinc-cadmium efflux system membrane fusion protein
MDMQESTLARRSLPLAKQIRIVLVVALVAGGALLITLAALRARATEPASEGLASPATPGSVRLSAAQLATLETYWVRTRSFRSEEITDGQITLNGDTSTQVFSPYSGRVLRVMAEPGELVKKGAPLLQIEASEYVQAESDLLNAAANLKLARASEARKHAAYDSKGGSLQDWQQAQADLAAAETAFAAARNRLRIFGKSDQQIAAIESSRQPAATTYVVAPIGGVVTDRQVGPGQYLQAGSSTPVFTLGDLSTVWLVAAVREADAALVRRGQRIEVRVLALPGELFTATLTAVAAQVDPVTRRVAVRATLANPDGKLKPQMFATFSIITGDESVAPAVPEEAVVREGAEARVWIIQPDNTLSLRQIRTGRVDEGMVEVVRGLAAGERVVTRGSLFIDRAAHTG